MKGNYKNGCIQCYERDGVARSGQLQYILDIEAAHASMYFHFIKTVKKRCI